MPADTTETTEASAGELRSRMVEALHAEGHLRSPTIAAGFGQVPREIFVPEVALPRAYDLNPVTVKRDADGQTLSSVSGPGMIAICLEQLDPRPGQRVLEIGSGGYTAAVLAEIVGPGGSVTSIDVDPEIVERARRFLDAAGYRRVVTACADGESGWADSAPYDRIIVTAAAVDVPPAWLEQLAPGGVLVVPLWMRTLCRTLGLHAGEEPGCLVGRGDHLASFVPMQGASPLERRRIPILGDEVWVVDDGLPGSPPIDAAALARAISGPSTASRTELRTSVYARHDEPIDALEYFLLSTLPSYCRVTMAPSAIERGVLRRMMGWGVVALVEGASFAHLTTCGAGDGPGRFEFGVDGYGPRGRALAEVLVRAVRAWDREHRGGPGPVVRVYPAGTPDDRLAPGMVLDRPRRRVTITWP